MIAARTLAALAVVGGPTLHAQPVAEGSGASAPSPPVVRAADAGAAPARRAALPPERVRRERAAAQAAQAAFERGRAWLLPRTPAGGSGAACEVRVGRICYWDNNADPPPPPEPASVVAARDRLLDRLVRTAAAAPEDGWTVGQQVRYQLEAGRPDSALAAGRRCAAEPWWCAALRGLALHVAARDPAATAATFDSAVALLPPAERCAWRDLSPWLEGRDLAAWRATGCGTPARARWEAAFWRLAQPLWSLPGNDLRSELDARRVVTRLHAAGLHAQLLPWDDDLAEVELRYGWPTAWSRRAGDFTESTPRIVGHEPVPSRAFVPPPGRVAALVADPGGARAEDWTLDAPLPRMRYAPRWAASGFSTIHPQVARFRRGDSTMVTASWSVDSASWRSAPHSARLLLVAPRRLPAGEPDAARDASVDSTAEVWPIVARDSSSDSGAVSGVLVARYLADRDALIVGVELVAAAARRAARARQRLLPLPSAAPLSDVLLLRPGVGPTGRAEEVLDRTLGATVIEAGGTVQLFWERYRTTSADSLADTVAVTATRTELGFGDRVRRAVGLDVVRQPVAVRYVDRGRPDGAPGRAVAVRWPAVPPGRHRLELVVRGSGGEVGRRALDVRVVARSGRHGEEGVPKRDGQEPAAVQPDSAPVPALPPPAGRGARGG